jgi:threonine-phosphate decarboxylase
MPAAALEDLCRRHRQVRFVVDESYLPFVRDGENESLVACSHPNLVVLNSMSKIFRVPGLRIGFAVAPQPIVDILRPHILPWSVNALAQAAVHFLMTREPGISNFIRSTREFLETERNLLRRRLGGDTRFVLFESTTAFVLTGLGSALSAEGICAELAAARILIRNCANFTGLSSRYVRVSLKTAEANRDLAQRLLAIASGTGNAPAEPAAVAGGGRR